MPLQQADHQLGVLATQLGHAVTAILELPNLPIASARSSVYLKCYSITFRQRQVPTTVSPVVEGDSQPILSKLHEPDVTLAVWHRSLPCRLADWLDSLPREQLPEAQFTGPAACVAQRAATVCDLVGLPDSAERRALVNDIAALAQAFARLARSQDIDLRLEAVDHDSCWRFHRDHVGLRLNTTYRGPGTQWLPPEHAPRALKAQRRYRGPLNEMPRFAVGLFKGVERAGADAVVHRSPPVVGTGQTRLFLCLNEVRDDG